LSPISLCIVCALNAFRLVNVQKIAVGLVTLAQSAILLAIQPNGTHSGYFIALLCFFSILSAIAFQREQLARFIPSLKIIQRAVLEEVAERKAAERDNQSRIIKSAPAAQTHTKEESPNSSKLVPQKQRDRSAQLNADAHPTPALLVSSEMASPSAVSRSVSSRHFPLSPSGVSLSPKAHLPRVGGSSSTEPSSVQNTPLNLARIVALHSDADEEEEGDESGLADASRTPELVGSETAALGTPSDSTDGVERFSFRPARASNLTPPAGRSRLLASDRAARSRLLASTVLSSTEDEAPTNMISSATGIARVLPAKLPKLPSMASSSQPQLAVVQEVKLKLFEAEIEAKRNSFAHEMEMQRQLQALDARKERKRQARSMQPTAWILASNEHDTEKQCPSQQADSAAERMLISDTSDNTEGAPSPLLLKGYVLGCMKSDSSSCYKLQRRADVSTTSATTSA
jgi:hypothetical protein